MPQATPNLSLLDFSDPGSLQSGIGKATSSQLSQGSDLTSSGLAAFAPIISRLQKIVSGDASEIDQEAAPEISGVKSSYQSARDAITNFTPRGGWLASSMAANRTGEASDIAKVRASVRSGAQSDLEKIAGGLLSTGTNEQTSAIGNFGNLLSAGMQQQQSNRSFWGSIGSAAAGIAMAFL